MGCNKGMQNVTTFTNKDSESINLIVQYNQINQAMLKTACEEFFSKLGTRGTNAHHKATS